MGASVRCPQWGDNARAWASAHLPRPGSGSPSSSKTGRSTSPPDSAMANILLVEDDADNRVIYRVILEHSGHEVIEAWNGEDGVRSVKSDAVSP